MNLSRNELDLLLTLVRNHVHDLDLPATLRENRDFREAKQLQDKLHKELTDGRN